MAYYIDIFSPETYHRFSNSGKEITGFTQNKKATAAGVRPGDKLICYVTKLSRWVGLLEVVEGPFTDDTPLFTEVADPFTLRFKVRCLIWLPYEKAVPITSDLSWKNLTFTRELPPGSSRWTIWVRSSLGKMNDENGTFLENLMLKQAENGHEFPLTQTDLDKLKAPKVKTTNNREVTVSIPENTPVVSTVEEPLTFRESIRMQAYLAEIGERMRLKIWIPRSDKQRVLDLWHPREDCLLEQLPLNYDDATLKTIENIDVLWIKGRSIVRAFEVEHTTSIYSGILRMADLMALQPNLYINAHIVAPLDRKEKVFEELTRPVFTYLEKGPLQESCSFISYDSIIELSKEKRLEYMTDAVLEEYAEYAEEIDG